MKIFGFYYNNYFLGWRTFRVLANSREEALEIIENDPMCHKFIWDDDTTKSDEEFVEELDKPKIIQ